MLSISHDEDDVTPVTKRSDNFPTATIILAARVDRLAELAQERLLLEPDEGSLCAAATDLAEIRQLCRQVLR